MGIEENKSAILFAEGESEATILAAHNLALNNICQPILLGDMDRIQAIATGKGIDLKESGVDIVCREMVNKNDLKKYTEMIYEKANRGGIS